MDGNPDLQTCCDSTQLKVLNLDSARKSFNGKFNAKIDFPIGHFMLPLLMLTSKV